MILRCCMFLEWGANCLLGLFCAQAAYVLAVFLHEAGHALLGMLSGARCLWLRIGCVLWVPGGGVFVKPGRGGGAQGECVLSCPDKKSCFWAALGGGAANIAAGTVCAWRWNFSGFLWAGDFPVFFLMLSVFKILFAVSSFLMAIFSLLPCKAAGASDARTARALCGNGEFYERLRRNQQRDLLRLEFGMLEEMY